MGMQTRTQHSFSSTQNACKLCTPLGAALAFMGMEKAVPLLHGSQGCSTYIRRYLISHFKEPVDVASSNFGEHTAIFGGGANLKLAIENIAKQYNPSFIGIATTCLSETIGDDVPMILKQLELETNGVMPLAVHVSTPSYRGTHMDGFHAAVRAVVDVMNPAQDILPAKESGSPWVNVFPGLWSPEDLRYLKEILCAYEFKYVMLPDYSQRLDGVQWMEYQTIQPGGTPVAAIERMSRSSASLQFSTTVSDSGAEVLKTRFQVPVIRLAMPIGVGQTDALMEELGTISGVSMPQRYEEERGRLIDAYVDGHKYVSQLRAVLYGEEDLVVGVASFLGEIGIIPVVCASGGNSGLMASAIKQILPEADSLGIMIREGADFAEIEQLAEQCKPNIIIGNSKGRAMANRLGIPLVRIGFPIHDRFGGARVLHIGYRGAMQLFDRIVNAILEANQNRSSVGYSYM